MIRLAAPIAALALTAAAPADFTAAATCAFDQAATRAAFGGLPVLSTEDDTEDNERGTILTFDTAAATIWAAPATRIQLFDYAIPTEQHFTMRYETSLAGEYGPARDRLFAANAKTRCDREFGSAGARSCELALTPDGDWRRAVTLSESSGGLMLGCAFAKGG